MKHHIQISFSNFNRRNLHPQMKRIIIIGCPGSGKSTFSRELHRITNIPLYHLDMLFRNPDKTTVEKSLFRNRLADILTKEEWIIDGNYGSTMEMRIRVCDTVVFLDYPVEVCLDGIRSRKGKERPDMPWIESENEDDSEFITFIKNYNTESRPKVVSLLEKYTEKMVLIFHDRNEADEFLYNLGKQ